jgi:hypothetical protein
MEIAVGGAPFRSLPGHKSSHAYLHHPVLLHSWKGFFDLIGRCDEYVVFDSAQYVKRHWHNRNRIKTANGIEWLTIPVIAKGRFAQPIDEVKSKNRGRITRAAGADRYLSGPSARAYFDESLFASSGIATEWMSYEGYPEYPRLHGGFEHAASTHDLLFNTGPDAARYLMPARSQTAV